MSRAQKQFLLLAAGAAVIAVMVARGAVGREVFVFLAVLVPSVILHEVAHGASALAFGDPTAREAGRLTLNPVAHVDPVWTLLIPGMLALAGAPVIGAAKPVPVNPRRMRHPRNHGLLVALAGPATNIVIAVVAAAAYRSLRPSGVAAEVVLGFGIVNVVLAVFNLIPLPPLDGSALVERILPYRWWEPYLRFRQYSMGILLLVVLVAPGGLSRLFRPAISLWARLL